MVAVDPFKVPPPDSMACSYFIFNINAINIFLPKIILYVPLAE